jgi:RNase P/RNase MRP subunit p30
LNATDLNLRIKHKDEIQHFLRIAEGLGFDQLAVPSNLLNSYEKLQEDVTLLSRIDLPDETLGKLKGALNRYRTKHVIVAVQVSDPSVSNWAAKDERIDLLTLAPMSDSVHLRQSTAKLAAKSGIALELTLAPLLETQGFDRSRTLKSMREDVSTAVNAGMKVVFCSGANKPMMMRSPRALCYVGKLLGLDRTQAKAAVYNHPDEIVQSNLRKLTGKFVRPGVEVLEK